MQKEYLIPANSKRSMLIFSVFRVIDLIIFGAGLGASMILLLVLPITTLSVAIIALLPGLTAGLLVLPIPNYHNVRVLLESVFTFYTSRQKFIWKGWCFLDGQSDSEKQIYKR